MEWNFLSLKPMRRSDLEAISACLITHGPLTAREIINLARFKNGRSLNHMPSSLSRRMRLMEEFEVVNQNIHGTYIYDLVSK